MLKLKLYSRPGCHLCDRMRDDVQEFFHDLPFELHIINIDQDPGLQQEYAGRIPVLMLGDVLLAEYFLDTRSVAAKLDLPGIPGG
ncbi:MAG: glutaredoxin family protein [Gammaproteobacteria bacterium]|nr:glutaredoxin family protein [Gammaproteobacteria bacterium]